MINISAVLTSISNEQTGMLALLIAAGVFIVAGIVSFIITNYFQNNLHRRLKDKSNTVRIYMIDVANDKVEYFNSSKLRNKNNVSITTFYTHFDSKDRQKLISWIGDLANDVEGTKNFMEIGAFVKRFRKNVPSILHVQKVDLNKKIIYLESYLLGGDEAKAKEFSFISKDRLLKAIRQRDGIGFSFCFNFYNKFTHIDEISNLAYIEIKNIIQSFINDKVAITEYQDTRFFVSNFECDNKIEALDFVNKVKAKVNSYLLIDSFSDEIDISVGATENLFFKRDTRNFFRILNNLTDFAKDNKQEILFFDESKKVANEESTFKTEVENIIDKGKLQYFYQPIYSFKYNRVTSYFSSIKPFDTVFESIDDLRKFAVRTDDDQELFNTIAKNAITQFVQEKGPLNVRLFFGLSINEFAYAASSLAHIPGIKDANVILYIDEREIENLSEKEEDSITNFINSIRTIKSNGYDVALIIENDILTLSPKIYGLFDYYIVKAKDYIANKKENRIPAFKALIENLIRYNKSILAIDIPTWDAVDLVYKFGIENISGDALSIKRENVVPLDKKTFLKIKKLKA